MCSKFTIVAAATTLVVLLSTAAVPSAQAQYRGNRADVYGYGPYLYAPRTFDDYVGDRLRQLQIQRQYGAPYYPYLDRRGYYDYQRYRSDVFRPYYEGRQFRYNRPYYDYDYTSPYNSYQYRYYLR